MKISRKDMRKLPFDVFDVETGEKIEMPQKRERMPAKDGTNRGTKPIYVTPEQWHTIESIAGFWATDEEIGAAIGVSHWTLTDDYHGKFFQAIKKRGRSEGKLSLRRWQFQSAKNGSVAMQIFLGKNILGQSDKCETDISATFPVVITEDIRE